MTIDVYYKGTKRHIDYGDICSKDYGKNLMEYDIDCFAITEYGNLILLDDCGNIAYIPREDKYTISVKFDFCDGAFQFDY